MSRAGTIALWSTGLTLALGLHAAGAYTLLGRWHSTSEELASGLPIMLELAPAPIAPAVTPTETPPGPQQAEAQAEPAPVTPVEMTDLPTAREAKLPIAPPPKPDEKPKEKRPPQKRTSHASAPSPAERHASTAAAPAPGASERASEALANWRSLLYARIDRFKRAPGSERGIVQLAFSVDRNGGVHHARITQSSGSSVLDRETLDLIARAQPLPPPPAEIAGAQIAVVVPIRYNFH